MKTRTCKSCGGTVIATRNDESQPIYECRCCGEVTPRRINKNVKREIKQAGFAALVAELAGCPQ